MSDLAHMLQQGDPDRFAATLAAPPALRARLWPIYALNLELARAPWAAQNPMLGEMRLQWWADQLAALPRQERPADPVLAALHPMVQADAGLIDPLNEIAVARRADCWDEPFEDRAALLAYIDGTAGAVMRAAQCSLGGQGGDLSPFWRAQGLAAFWRAVPALQARGRRPLAQIAPADLADLAVQALAALRAGAAPPLPVRAAVYPCFGAAAVLRQVARDPGRIASGGLGLPEFRRRAGLLWMAFSGRIT